MKTKTILIALFLGLVAFWGCDDNSTGSDNGSSDSVTELEGTWIGTDDEGNPVTMNFNGNVCDFALSAHGTVYSTFTADFQIHSNENPKEIDMTITSSVIDGEIDTAVGMSPLGIYMIEDDILTIYNTINPPRPTSFEIEDTEGNLFMFVILSKL